MKLGFPLPEILSYFDYLFKNKAKESSSKFPVPLGGKMERIDEYEVPIDLPRYRLANTRTIALQAQFISANNLPKDFFESDPLSDRLQEIQHNILKELIARKDLKKYFEENEQTLPLILTNEGFVISGNRRLCAFRELFYDPDNGSLKYKRFERIMVVILPKLSEEEIEFIEDYYEQQPDIQDEFTWVNKALGFEKRLIKHGYNVDILSKKSNVSKNIIEGLLSKLTAARDYLEFIGKPNTFSLVENDEFAFNELLKSRKKFDDDPVEKETFHKVSYIALKNQDQLTDRMYKNIPIIQEVLDDIKEGVLSELGDQISKVKVTKESDNPLDEAVQEDVASYAILEVIENPENEEVVCSIIIDKVNERKLSKQEGLKKQAVLKKIQKAHKELVDALNIISYETNIDGIEDQLNNIKTTIEKIREWLNNGNH